MVRPVVQMRPDRCSYCSVLYAALGYTLEEALKKGYDVTDLGGDLATKEDLERVIAEKAPIFFNAAGHGNEKTFTGQDTRTVLKVGVNEGILAGMITYLQSCLTGIELGPAIVAAGGWSYIGYDVKWTWIDEDGEGDPFVDKYAEGFWEGSNIIPIAILNGFTTKEAQQAGYDKYTEWIDYWAASDDPHASNCVHWLTHDRAGCILLGDYGAGIGVVTHTLTVNSDPSAALIHVDGIVCVTPKTINISEGLHTVSIPEAVWIEGFPYGLDYWEDGSVARVREINLTSNMTITAYLKQLPSYLLTVNSNPISVIPFTINEGEYVTPHSENLLEGNYTVSMPSIVEVNGIRYRFLEWEDGSTNPVRTLSVPPDTSITAYYIAVYTLRFDVHPTLGAKLMIDGIEYTTPGYLELDEGTSLIITAPTSFMANGATYTFVKWEDGTTDPVRPIEVTGDITITAYYQGKGDTPLTITLKPGTHTISVPEIITV